MQFTDPQKRRNQINTTRPLRQRVAITSTIDHMLDKYNTFCIFIPLFYSVVVIT